VAASAVVLGFGGGFAAGYGRGPVLSMPRELLDERRAAFTATLCPLTRETALEAALSPDGLSAAYAVAAEDGTDLFLAPLSGADAARKISDEAGGRAPFFSPDGRTLLFSGARSGTEPAVWQVPTDGATSPVLLVAEGEEPALSRDGTTLAFVRRSERGTALWLAARDGTAPRLLLELRRSLRLPVFSRDGRSLLAWDVRTSGHGSGGARLVSIALGSGKLVPFGTNRLFSPAGRPVLLPAGAVAALSWEERRAAYFGAGSPAPKNLPFGAGLALLAGSPAGVLTRAAAGPFVLWK
jgi:hypothetical protein